MVDLRVFKIPVIRENLSYEEHFLWNISYIMSHWWKEMV